MKGAGDTSRALRADGETRQLSVVGRVNYLRPNRCGDYFLSPRWLAFVAGNLTPESRVKWQKRERDDSCRIN